jgi:hypothetical protein
VHLGDARRLHRSIGGARGQNYKNHSGDRGIGLVLEFPDEQAATTYFDLYRKQIQACTRKDQPVRTAILTGVDGLVERRTYPDSK